MRFLKFAVLAALIILTTSRANAGILGSTLTFNGSEDRLSTISPAGLASVIDVDGSGSFNPNNPNDPGLLTEGDVVFGFMVSATGVNDFLTGSGASAMDFQTGYAVALFAAELEIGSGGFNLIPVTSSGNKLEDLIDPVFGAAIAGLDAMVAVISGGLGENPQSGNIFADNAGDDGLKYYSSADFDLEFAADLHDAGSGAGFFQFAPAGGLALGFQRGGFNVIDGIGDLGFAPIEFLNVATSSIFSPPATTVAHIGLDNTLVNAGSAALSRDWLYETTSAGIRLNTVPEPGTLAIFIGIAGMGFVRRRNKR